VKRTVEPYSISRRLSRQLAIQTAAGLLVVCGVILALAYWQFERKHLQELNTKLGVVQEIVRATQARGEAAVVQKLELYAQRRPGTFLVIQRADGSEVYRDRESTIDLQDHDDWREGSFELSAPAVEGGVLRGRLLLDCGADQRMLAALALALAALALGGGALVGWAAYWRVRHGLAPLLDLAAQTRAIDADRLGQRLSLARPVEELQPAVDQFNALMSRLERAYVQLEGFNADVAHELRTPLAALIGHTELALSRERSPQALCETLASNLEELQRLSAMVNDMLFLASADRGAVARRGASVSLARLARQVVDFHEAAIEDARLSVEIDGDAALPLDEPLIKRALSNLISNATRHARPGSVLRVQIVRAGTDQVRLEVINEGEPIDAAALPRIFDRFFRADDARGGSAEAAHHGLGLAIVAAIARMHRGQVLASSGQGFTRVGLSMAGA
jgi:two-component system, OmpR family, heavy metal sensor histidine kinase CusS